MTYAEHYIKRNIQDIILDNGICSCCGKDTTNEKTHFKSLNYYCFECYNALMLRCVVGNQMNKEKCKEYVNSLYIHTKIINDHHDF